MSELTEAGIIIQETREVKGVRREVGELRKVS